MIGRRLEIIGSLGLALLGACSPPIQTVALASEGQRIDLLETLYRHQMSQIAVREDGRQRLFCLRLARDGQADGDPPTELVARFASSPDLVKPNSACRITDQSEGAAVVDRTTGGQGVIIAVGNIVCRSPQRCTAEGGSYAGNQGASSVLFVVELRNQRWVVLSDELEWIS